MTAFVLAATAVLTASPAFAAAGTTCLCRSADGKAFTEKTLRHHRWACDHALGYIKDKANDLAGQPGRLELAGGLV